MKKSLENVLMCEQYKDDLIWPKIFLSLQTKAALQALIEKHQKIPGNIFRALMERFQTQKKED